MFSGNFPSAPRASGALQDASTAIWTPGRIAAVSAALSNSRPAFVVTVWTDFNLERWRGKVRIGAELFCAADLRQALDAARQDGLDFACSPLSHPRNARARGASASGARAGDAVGPRARVRRVVAAHRRHGGAWPRLDASCAQQRRDGEAALTRSLAVGLAPVLGGRAAAAAAGRRLCQWRAGSGDFSESDVVAGVGALPPPRVARGGGEAALLDPGSTGRRVDPWLRWDRVRRLCDHSAALCVALRADGDAPSVDAARRCRRRAAEVRARAVRLVSDALRRAFPCCRRRTRTCSLHYRSSRSSPTRDWGSHPRQSYVSYLRHLIASARAVARRGGDRRRPYRDYLQAPLQPLADNLEANTYETLSGPREYARYEDGGQEILRRRGRARVVVVAGAGRGPLVAAVLRAASDL